MTAPSARLGLPHLRSWLEAVAQISAAVNNVEPIDNVLSVIAATTCRLLGYDFAAVLLTDRDMGQLIIRGSFGLSPTYVESINTEHPVRLGHGPFGEGPSSRAFRSRRPIVVEDSQRDPSLGPWAGVAIEQGYRSITAVPLVVTGRAIGTLTCYTRELHEFPREELLLLSTIANQAAIAIETKRLRDEERATIARLEQATRSLEAQASVLEASEQIHVQLTRVVLEDAGLVAIAEALTRVLHGSVVIVDMAGNPLGTSAFGDIPVVLPPALRENRAVAARIEAFLTGQEPRAVSVADEPALEHRAFVAPILIGREPVGRLWVLGVVEDLGALERRALEHGATVIALELLKQRTAADVEARLHGELLDDLLSERLLDPQSLRTRAGHLDLDLDLPYAALVMGFDRPPETALNDRRGRSHQLVSLAYSVVRRAHAAALTGTDRDGRVVVLLADSGNDAATAVPIADTIRREARYLLPTATVSVAIGPVAVGQPGYLRSYRIARGALELARDTTPDRTLRVDALGLHGLLLSVERLDELVAFAACQLDPLSAYDVRRGGDLVATLRTYLANGCRTAETAVALVVHPNTVAYRIRRIQAVLGVDLAQPTTQLALQLALIVLEILGTTKATRERVPREP